METLTAFTYTLLLLTAHLLMLVLFGRTIFKIGKKISYAFSNRKAKKNLASLGLVSKTKTKTGATPSKASKSSSSKVIKPFNEVIDYSVYEAPLIENRERLEDFVQRAIPRRNARAELLGSSNKVTIPNDSDAVIVPIISNENDQPEEREETPLSGELDKMKEKLKYVFKDAPQASQEIPDFMKA